jgi:hypothetical protein
MRSSSSVGESLHLVSILFGGSFFKEWGQEKTLSRDGTCWAKVRDQVFLVQALGRQSHPSRIAWHASRCRIVIVPSQRSDAKVQTWRSGLPRRFETGETFARTWNSARRVPKAITICEQGNYDAPFLSLSIHNKRDSGSRAVFHENQSKMGSSSIDKCSMRALIIFDRSHRPESSAVSTTGIIFL